MKNKIIGNYKDILIFDEELEGLVKKNVWIIECCKGHKFMIKSNTLLPDDYVIEWECPTCYNSNYQHS